MTEDTIRLMVASATLPDVLHWAVAQRPNRTVIMRDPFRCLFAQFYQDRLEDKTASFSKVGVYTGGAVYLIPTWMKYVERALLKASPTATPLSHFIVALRTIHHFPGLELPL